MFKELLLITCVIGVCYSAVIKNAQPEVDLSVPGNAVEEVNESQSSDLETAEGKHFGFGPKVLVVNKSFGGHGRGCGCGGGGYGHSHYHSHHRYYGKK